MKLHRVRSIFLSILSLAIVAGLVYFLYTNADQYLQLLRLSAPGIVGLLILSLTFPVLNGLLNTYMFRGLGTGVTHREGFLLAAAATLANQLPLPGGIVARGVYLKHKHSLSYTKYFSAQLALFVCTVAVDGFVGLGVLLDGRFSAGAAFSPVLLAAFVAMAASLFVFWLPVQSLKMPAALRKWNDQALDGWMLFAKNPVLLMKLLGLQMCMMVLLAMRYWLAFHMLSQNVTAGQVLLFSSASVLTQLISFAPGGLGVREAIVGAVATALGFDLTVSVAAVGLDRLLATLTVVLVGWISTVILGRQISKITVKTEPRQT